MFLHILRLTAAVTVPVLWEHDVVFVKLLPAEVLSRASLIIAVPAPWLFSANGGVEPTATFWPGIETLKTMSTNINQCTFDNYTTCPYHFVCCLLAFLCTFSAYNKAHTIIQWNTNFTETWGPKAAFHSLSQALKRTHFRSFRSMFLWDTHHKQLIVKWS